MIKQFLIFILTLCIFYACTNDSPKHTTSKQGEDVVKNDTTTHTDEETTDKGGGTPLTITVTGIETDDAPVVVRVYTEGNFLNEKPDKFKFRVQPKGGRATHTVKGMPYGNIAVVVYQDMNDNDDMDRNAVGVPEEPYAFSNNFRPKVKAPAFSDCSFTYSESANTVAIAMPGKK